jgi:hypothetical protein
MKYKLMYDDDAGVWEIRILDETGDQLAIDYSIGNKQEATDMALWMIASANAERGKGAAIHVNDDKSIKILDPAQLQPHTKNVIHCWNAEWMTPGERAGHIDDMIRWVESQ